MTKLHFEVSVGVDNNGKAIQVGTFSRDWHEEEDMDALQAKLDHGRIQREEAINEGKRLLNKYPDNMELHNFLGCQLWNDGLKDDACALWEKGHKLGAALIPRDFKGQVSWYEVDNRSFLRVTYGYVLGLAHQAHVKQALAWAKRLLAWNPSDNQGVRLLIGDFQLMAGDYKGAMKSILKEAPNFPTLWYRAGLIAYREGDFVRACTYLRRGIAGNPYVAEGLTGRTLLADHLYFHSNDTRGCDWAIDYLQSPVNDWCDEEIDFVDWLFNCSDVLRERANFMENHEGLTYEHDFAARGQYVDWLFCPDERITDALSEQLVRKIVNRWGDAIWPWDRDGMNRPLKAEPEPVGSASSLQH